MSRMSNLQYDCVLLTLDAHIFNLWVKYVKMSKKYIRFDSAIQCFEFNLPISQSYNNILFLFISEMVKCFQIQKIDCSMRTKWMNFMQRKFAHFISCHEFNILFILHAIKCISAFLHSFHRSKNTWYANSYINIDSFVIFEFASVSIRRHW